MPDISTQLERLEELSKLLLEMSKEYNMVKFSELDRKFSALQAIYRLEDEVNQKEGV
jgi:hypothetical protein